MFAERILVLIPHPDDEVVGAATALARLRAHGGHATGAFLTSGVPANAGAWIPTPRRYARRVARRTEESTRVAEELDLAVAGRRPIPSRELKRHLAESLRWLREEAESARADLLWVPAYEGGHPDHDVANFLASKLADEYEVWEFSEYHFAKGRVSGQTFVRPNGSEALLSLDGAERARKRRLLDVYASERRNLGYVGLEQECFRPLAAYDYGERPHPGKCFYERFHWVPFHPRIDYCRAEDVCEALLDFA